MPMATGEAPVVHTRRRACSPEMRQSAICQRIRPDGDREQYKAECPNRSINIAITRFCGIWGHLARPAVRSFRCEELYYLQKSATSATSWIIRRLHCNKSSNKTAAHFAFLLWRTPLLAITRCMIVKGHACELHRSKSTCCAAHRPSISVWRSGKRRRNSTSTSSANTGLPSTMKAAEPFCLA